MIITFILNSSTLMKIEIANKHNYISIKHVSTLRYYETHNMATWRTRLRLLIYVPIATKFLHVLYLIVLTT